MPEGHSSVRLDMPHFLMFHVRGWTLSFAWSINCVPLLPLPSTSQTRRGERIKLTWNLEAPLKLLFRKNILGKLYPVPPSLCLEPLQLSLSLLYVQSFYWAHWAAAPYPRHDVAGIGFLPYFQAGIRLDRGPQRIPHVFAVHSVQLQLLKLMVVCSVDGSLQFTLRRI